MPECPDCKQYVQLGRRTCPHCQVSLARPCPYCGYALPGILRMCPQCRERLDGPTAPAPAPAPLAPRAVPRPLAEPSPPPAPRPVPRERWGQQAVPLQPVAPQPLDATRPRQAFDPDAPPPPASGRHRPRLSPREEPPRAPRASWEDMVRGGAPVPARPAPLPVQPRPVPPESDDAGLPWASPPAEPEPLPRERRVVRPAPEEAPPRVAAVPAPFVAEDEDEDEGGVYDASEGSGLRHTAAGSLPALAAATEDAAPAPRRAAASSAEDGTAPDEPAPRRRRRWEDDEADDDPPPRRGPADEDSSPRRRVAADEDSSPRRRVAEDEDAPPRRRVAEDDDEPPRRRSPREDDEEPDRARAARPRAIRTWADLARGRDERAEPERAPEPSAAEPEPEAEDERRSRSRRGGVRTWADLGGGGEAAEDPPRSRAEDDEARPSRRDRSEDDDGRGSRRARAELDEEEPRSRSRALRDERSDEEEDEPRSRPARRGWGDEDESAAPRSRSSAARAEDDEPPPRSRVRSWRDADEDEPPRPARRTWGEEEDAAPRPARRTWGDDDSPAPRSRSSAARGEEDEPRRGRSGRPLDAEESDPPRPPRGEGAAAGPVDGSLGKAVHDELRGQLFAGLLGALDIWVEASDFISLLEAIDPNSLLDELQESGQRLPRSAEKILRRKGVEGLSLGAGSLGEDVERALRGLEAPWRDLGDALRAMRKGAIIPEEDGEAYLSAARAARAGLEGPKGLKVAAAPTFVARVGDPLGSPFRRSRRPDGDPRRLLGTYHECLRDALSAADAAWEAIFAALARAVAAAGGPQLGEAGELKAMAEEAARLQEKALALLEEGEARKALKVVTKAVEAVPDDPAVLIFALRVANQARNKEEADRLQKVLEQKFPDDPAGLAARAELLVQRGEERAARALLEKALQASPTERSVLELLGGIYLKQREPKRAAEVYRTLAELAPKVPEFLLALARAEGLQDHEDEAIDALQRFARITEMDADRVNKLKADEAFDCLAADPRFDALLAVDLDLLALADSLFREGSKGLYFGDEVPPSKLNNAQKKWLKMEEDETLVFLIDTTMMGRCTDGVAVTDERVIWKDMGCDPESFPLSKLRADRLRNDGGTIRIGKRSLSLVGQPGLADPMLSFLSAVARSNK